MVVSRVFICYRRTDAEADAGRIRDHLIRSRIRRRAVVRDLDCGAEPGQDYTVWMERELSRCTRFLVIIGPKWLELLAERKRLEVEKKQPDRVNQEIDRALRLCLEDPRKRIVPVLVRGAELPTSEELERIRPNLKTLAVLQTFVIHQDRFIPDVRLLIREVPGDIRPVAALSAVAIVGMLAWNFGSVAIRPLGWGGQPRDGGAERDGFVQDADQGDVSPIGQAKDAASDSNRRRKQLTVRVCNVGGYPRANYLTKTTDCHDAPQGIPTCKGAGECLLCNCLH